MFVGHIQLYLNAHFDPHTGDVRGGRLIWDDHNMIMNNSYNREAAWWASNTQNGGSAIKSAGFIALGTSTTAPTINDTKLGFELTRTVVASASVQSSYTGRLVASFDGNHGNGDLTEMGLFDVAGDGGTSTGANTGTTLHDTGKAWTVNQWTGFTVYIISGTGVGQIATISSNTATVLTVGSAWSVTPDVTSVYTIGGVGSGNYLFAHSSITAHKVSGNTMTAIWTVTALT